MIGGNYCLNDQTDSHTYNVTSIYTAIFARLEIVMCIVMQK